LKPKKVDFEPRLKMKGKSKTGRKEARKKAVKGKSKTGRKEARKKAVKGAEMKEFVKEVREVERREAAAAVDGEEGGLKREYNVFERFQKKVK